MTEGLVLARRSQAAQLRAATDTEAAMRFLWQSVDVARLDASFDAFRAGSLSVVGSGRASTLDLAGTYYAEARELAGHDPLGGPSLTAPDLDADKLTVDLYVNGPAAVKRAVARGEPADQAAAAAGERLAGVGKRYALNASRHATIKAAAKDRVALGWARVSDGVPCSFCAMLVSRGPVYSAKSVHFKAHNRCGCTVRAVFEGEADGGWSPDARALADLWASAGDGKTWTRAEWRAHYNATLHDPEAPLTVALAETYREAGAAGVAAAV